jgi:hypothetical protein
MKEEILKLYKEYCDEVDRDERHWSEHEDYKKDFGKFMKYLEDGVVIFYL